MNWRIRSGAAPVAIGALLAAGCGGAVLATARTQPTAATPTSAGAVNPSSLPLGDGYVSSRPRAGYVDSCITHFGGIGGAQVNGPWINSRTRTWDLSRKLAVQGNVRWSTGYLSVSRTSTKRVVRFNDIPINHTTGVFPIAASDPAYRYDHNPNHIAVHPETWMLPASPRRAAQPACTGGGPIGVLIDGAFLFNALDGEGRDAAAHEVLDRCAGHPDGSFSYHHHDIPPCILSRARRGRATLVGYALDGFGIYVIKNRAGALPTNRSLDACHGTTSRVPWDGRQRRIYHYVATLEYPYTVGCFRGHAISSGFAPPTGGPPGGAPPGGSPPPPA